MTLLAVFGVVTMFAAGFALCAWLVGPELVASWDTNSVATAKIEALEAGHRITTAALATERRIYEDALAAERMSRR